jgi:hypothetical protein
MGNVGLVGKAGTLSLIKKGYCKLLSMYEDTLFELSTKLLSTEDMTVTYIEPSCPGVPGVHPGPQVPGVPGVPPGPMDSIT